MGNYPFAVLPVVDKPPNRATQNPRGIAVIEVLPSGLGSAGVFPFYVNEPEIVGRLSVVRLFWHQCDDYLVLDLRYSTHLGIGFLGEGAFRSGACASAEAIGGRICFGVLSSLNSLPARDATRFEVCSLLLIKSSTLRAEYIPFDTKRLGLTKRKAARVGQGC